MIHGRIRRVVFDSAGVVIDAGRLRRLFDGAMRDLMRLHSPTCIFPGCNRPATWCQIDHLTDWQHGGTTTASQRRAHVRPPQPTQEHRLHRLARPQRRLPHLPPRRHRDRPTTPTPRHRTTHLAPRRLNTPDTTSGVAPGCPQLSWRPLADVVQWQNISFPS